MVLRVFERLSTTPPLDTLLQDTPQAPNALHWGFALEVFVSWCAQTAGSWHNYGWQLALGIAWA